MTWDELVDEALEYFEVSGGLLELAKSCRPISARLAYCFARPMHNFSREYPNSFIAICVAYEGHDVDGGKFNPNREFYFSEGVYLVSTDNPNAFSIEDVIDDGLIDDLFDSWLNEDKDELFPSYIKKLFTNYLSWGDR